MLFACLAAWPPALVVLWGTPSALAMAGKAALMLAVWLLTGAVLWRFWQSQELRTLRWSGQEWLLEMPGAAQAVELSSVSVRLDVQRCLLLRCRVAGQGTVWLWADAAHAPGYWHLLRCALYSGASRRRAGQLQASHPV